MFYSHDLLCRRKNGKFSIVWLAATNKKKLNRLSCLKVNISQTCDEIAGIITTQHSSDGRGQPRIKFSLYLSSLLMHGTCMVYRQQVDIFLSDLIIVQQGLSQVHLSEDGFLVHAAVKQRRPRDEEDESDEEEYGKSRPKKARKTKAKAKVTVLTVADIEEQVMAPLPVIPLAPPQPEGAQSLHLLNEADCRLPSLDLAFYQPMTGIHEGIMDIEALDQMGALFDQMNTSAKAQRSVQEAKLAVNAQEPAIEVVQEQPMEVEVPTTDLPKEQDALIEVPVEVEAVVVEDLAATVAQVDQELAVPLAQEEIIAPQLEEQPADLARETEPVDQPIPTVPHTVPVSVPEQEPEPTQPVTAQSPSSRKGKRKAAMPPPEPVPEKRKRFMRTFVDRKTYIDDDMMKRHITDPRIAQKTMRIQNYEDDIPDFHHVLRSTRIPPEEMLGIPAIDILNPTLKNLFQFKLQIIEKNTRASNVSAIDKSRAGSETSKVSFDRSRLSQHLSPMAEETMQISTSVPIPEEDLNIAQIDVGNVDLQQLEITTEIDLPAVMPNITETEPFPIPEVTPVLPTVEPTIADENLLQEPEAVVPTVQPEIDEQNLPREPEVLPTAQIEGVVEEPNSLALQQEYIEIPIEEQLLLMENFVVPSTPVNKDLQKKRERANGSIDSSMDSCSTGTPRSQTENTLLLSLDYYWGHSDKVVTFRSICHPSKATNKKAAKMFSLLLEMKKYQKVDLKQDDPMGFGPIEILPPNYSSNSSVRTSTS